MLFEQNVNMIVVVIPFLQGDVIAGTYIGKYIFETIGYRLVDDFASVFYDKNQVIE